MSQQFIVSTKQIESLGEFFVVVFPSRSVKLNYKGWEFTINPTSNIGWASDWSEYHDHVKSREIIEVGLGAGTYNDVSTYVTEDFYDRCEIVQVY